MSTHSGLIYITFLSQLMENVHSTVALEAGIVSKSRTIGAMWHVGLITRTKLYKIKALTYLWHKDVLVPSLLTQDSEKAQTLDCPPHLLQHQEYQELHFLEHFHSTMLLNSL